MAFYPRPLRFLQRLRVKRWDYYGVTLPDRFLTRFLGHGQCLGVVGARRVRFAQSLRGLAQVDQRAGDVPAGHEAPVHVQALAQQRLRPRRVTLGRGRQPQVAQHRAHAPAVPDLLAAGRRLHRQSRLTDTPRPDEAEQPAGARAAVAAAGGPPTPEQGAELGRLDAEMHTFERWDVGLLVVSLGLMAISRYLSF